MADAPHEDAPPAPHERWDFAAEEHHLRVPPEVATALLGGLALAVAIAAWTPPLAWLAWLDLPLNLLLFGCCAWLAFANLREVGRALPGLLLAGAGALLSAGHLVAGRAHPWLA